MSPTGTSKNTGGAAQRRRGILVGIAHGKLVVLRKEGELHAVGELRGGLELPQASRTPIWLNHTAPTPERTRLYPALDSPSPAKRQAVVLSFEAGGIGFEVRAKGRRLLPELRGSTKREVWGLSLFADA